MIFLFFYLFSNTGLYRCFIMIFLIFPFFPNTGPYRCPPSPLPTTFSPLHWSPAGVPGGLLAQVDWTCVEELHKLFARSSLSCPWNSHVTMKGTVTGCLLRGSLRALFTAIPIYRVNKDTRAIQIIQTIRQFNKANSTSTILQGTLLKDEEGAGCLRMLRGRKIVEELGKKMTERLHD